MVLKKQVTPDPPSSVVEKWVRPQLTTSLYKRLKLLDVTYYRNLSTYENTTIDRVYTTIDEVYTGH